MQVNKLYIVGFFEQFMTSVLRAGLLRFDSFIYAWCLVIILRLYVRKQSLLVDSDT